MSSKVFHWQYPGEEENRILRASNYELIDRTQVLFTHPERYAFKIFAKARINGRFPPADTDPVQDEILADNEEVEVFSTNNFRVPIYYAKTDYSAENNVQMEVSYSGRNGGSLYADYCTQDTKIFPIFTRYTNPSNGQESSTTLSKEPSTHFNPGMRTDIGFYGYRFEIVPNSVPRPCLNEVTSCTLEFYSDSQLVYERTESVCPSVWEGVSECPPGTCQVECGAHYCCYDFNGYAVTSIPK